MAGIPPPIRGDFDHDGKLDTAEVVATGRDTWAVVIHPGDKRRSISTLKTFWHGKPSNFYLAIERAGRMRTWCGKGGGSDDDPCPYKVIALRGQTLAFGVKDASESVALWNGRRFEIVLISD